jgi:LPS export ABC transporter permease LptF/LPS export ABC transporter permease LptG
MHVPKQNDPDTHGTLRAARFFTGVRACMLGFGMVRMADKPGPRETPLQRPPGSERAGEARRLSPLGSPGTTLIDRYIIREVLPPTALGLLIFTFILLLQQITILTGMLISRGADLPTIVKLFTNLLPSILATTIPMAFLLGILLAFGRLASDSEIVALRASGVSPAFLLRPVLILSLVTGLATFYVISVALPEANQAYRELYYSLVVGKARTGVKPRVFADDVLPGMVLYVSDISADTGQWHNVFINDTRTPNEPQVILARTGRLVIDERYRKVILHLEHGVSHTFGNPMQTEKDYQQRRFSSGDFGLDFDQLFPKPPLAKGGRELTLTELADRVRELESQKHFKEALRYRVEWHKKFAIPTACLVFGLLGLGLSLGSKKEARSAAFGLSIAVIFVYYVIIRLGEQAGDVGLVSPFLSMWGANIVLGVVAIALLLMNHREAAFDPLNPSHYTRWLPRIRRAERSPRARPSGGPSVVLRVPRASFGLPGILDRYIGRRYLGHLGLVVVSFWSLVILGNFLDLFDDIEEHRIRGLVVLHYYAFWAPFVVHLTAPLAVLVATLITFGVLSRANEITAMKAGGISIYRITLPTVVWAILASLCLFTLGDFILPYTNRVADSDRNTIRGRPPQSASWMDRRWLVGGDGGRIYHYDYLAVGQGSGQSDITAFYALSIYDLDPSQWELRSRLFATRAVWDSGFYNLERGWRLTLPAGEARFQPFEQLRTREVEKPGYFKTEQPDTDALGFADLGARITELEALHVDVVKLQVQLHRKIAFPSTCLIMTLIGIPFSFVVGRRGAFYGIFVSIVIAIVYWACLSIFEALGNNGLLPPLLAAWAPNLLFGAVGLYLMLTLET